MKRAYVLLYNTEVGDRAFVKSWVTGSPLVITWRYDLPNCFYIISEATAQTLSEEFRKYISPKGSFLFMEVSDNRQGYMVPETWYFLRHKTVQPNQK